MENPGKQEEIELSEEQAAPRLPGGQDLDTVWKVGNYASEELPLEYSDRHEERLSSEAYYTEDSIPRGLWDSDRHKERLSSEAEKLMPIFGPLLFLGARRNGAGEESTEAPAKQPAAEGRLEAPAPARPGAPVAAEIPAGSEVLVGGRQPVEAVVVATAGDGRVVVLDREAQHQGPPALRNRLSTDVPIGLLEIPGVTPAGEGSRQFFLSASGEVLMELSDAGGRLLRVPELSSHLPEQLQRRVILEGAREGSRHYLVRVEGAEALVASSTPDLRSRMYVATLDPEVHRPLTLPPAATGGEVLNNLYRDAEGRVYMQLPEHPGRLMELNQYRFLPLSQIEFHRPGIEIEPGQLVRVHGLPEDHRVVRTDRSANEVIVRSLQEGANAVMYRVNEEQLRNKQIFELDNGRRYYREAGYDGQPRFMELVELPNGTYARYDDTLSVHRLEDVRAAPPESAVEARSTLDRAPAAQGGERPADARRLSLPGGELYLNSDRAGPHDTEPAAVGIAMPRKIVEALQQRGLITFDQNWYNDFRLVGYVFHPGALAALREHGYFFDINLDTYMRVNLDLSARSDQPGATHLVPRQDYLNVLTAVGGSDVITMTDSVSGETYSRIRSGREDAVRQRVITELRRRNLIPSSPAD